MISSPISHQVILSCTLVFLEYFGILSVVEYDDIVFVHYIRLQLGFYLLFGIAVALVQKACFLVVLVSRCDSEILFLDLLDKTDWFLLAYSIVLESLYPSVSFRLLFF